MYNMLLKQQILELRRQGKTYGEIKSIVKINIPKSTLSNWCKNILLSQDQRDRINRLTNDNLVRARLLAVQVNKVKRIKYLETVDKRIKHIPKLVRNKNVAKVTLAILYLGEGAKSKKDYLMFGNSDPAVINLFLSLLRYSYTLDERKFRCTVQCRADQNIKKLEKFWIKVTNIPYSQFYKTQIDPRTIGKPSKKPNYKGVCRVEYFSADLAIELSRLSRAICEMGL